MQGNDYLYLAQEGQQSPSILMNLLPILLIVVVFYLLFWRPQQKRRKQEQQMLNTLVPGQQVLTKTGMYGTIVGIEDDEVELEISPGVTVRYIRQGIGNVVNPTSDLKSDFEGGIEDHPDFPGNSSDPRGDDTGETGGKSDR